VELTAGGDVGRVTSPFVEVGVAVGRFTPRFSIGVAPEPDANASAEESFFEVGEFERLVSEFEAGRADLVVDYDFGAHRVARGWSGGFRIHAGLGVSAERSYQFTRSRAGVVSSPGDVRVAPGPDAGATIQVWASHLGFRLGVTARGRARIGPVWTDELDPHFHLDWTETLAVTYAL
jgi:hypothetical protein